MKLKLGRGDVPSTSGCKRGGLRLTAILQSGTLSGVRDARGLPHIPPDSTRDNAAACVILHQPAFHYFINALEYLLEFAVFAQATYTAFHWESKQTDKLTTYSSKPYPPTALGIRIPTQINADRDLIFLFRGVRY
jgi:hypothetical protein